MIFNSRNTETYQASTFSKSKLKRASQLIIISLLMLSLTSCFTDKSSKRYDYTEHALSISLSKDGKHILVAHSKGHVDLSSLKKSLKPKKVSKWAHQDTGKTGVVASDFSKDKNFIVSIEQSTIARYSFPQKKIINFWSLDRMTDVKLSHLGDFALVASSEKKQDKKIGEYLHYRLMYFHLPTGKIKYAFYHDDVISSVALSEDGRFALSGSDDGVARLWDLESGELKHSWKHTIQVGSMTKKSKLSHVQLSPNGKYALTNNSNGDIRIYRTKSGKLYKKLSLPAATVSASMFSDDGKYLATGLTREQLILWRVKTGKIVKQWYPARRYFWQSSLARVSSLAFSGRKYLISVTNRGIAQKWKYR